jgi:hypothetical protein
VVALAVAHVGGGISGWDILYLGIYGLYTPIWDVLVPEGEQEGEGGSRKALENVFQKSRFQIRQVVPVGLGPQNSSGAHWAPFFIEKNVYCSKYSIITCNIPFSKCLGRREWMDGVGWVWMMTSQIGKRSQLASVLLLGSLGSDFCRKNCAL